MTTKGSSKTRQTSWHPRRHDVKNTWKVVCHDVKDIVMTSKSMPWIKGMSWRHKLCNDVKNFVLSKMSNTILVRLCFKNMLAPIWYLYDVSDAHEHAHAYTYRQTNTRITITSLCEINKELEPVTDKGELRFLKERSRVNRIFTTWRRAMESIPVSSHSQILSITQVYW